MKIVYKRKDGSIGILTPTSEALELYTINQIALKDVYPLLPYWIVENTEVPEDRTFRDAWEIPDEWGEPDGYGSEFTTFKEVLNAENK